MPRPNYKNTGCLRIRKKIGLSQIKMAELLGISSHTIVSLENERLGLSKKMKLRYRMLECPDECNAFIEEEVARYRKSFDKLKAFCRKLVKSRNLPLK